MLLQETNRNVVTRDHVSVQANLRKTIFREKNNMSWNDLVQAFENSLRCTGSSWTECTNVVDELHRKIHDVDVMCQNSECRMNNLDNIDLDSPKISKKLREERYCDYSPQLAVSKVFTGYARQK